MIHAHPRTLHIVGKFQYKKTWSWWTTSTSQRFSRNQSLKSSNEIYHGSDLFLMNCNILHVMHQTFLDFLYFQILEETWKQVAVPFDIYWFWCNRYSKSKIDCRVNVKNSSQNILSADSQPTVIQQFSSCFRPKYWPTVGQQLVTCR